MPTYHLADAVLTHLPTGLDHLGELLALPRLPGETNEAYQRRLGTVFVSPGNASYHGLLMAICREVGLLPQEALELRYLGTGVPFMGLAYQTLTLSDDDYQYSWSLRDLAVATLEQLTAAINATAVFQATLLQAELATARSLGLVWRHNRSWVLQEQVPSSRRFRLHQPPIVPGTVIFSDITTFARHDAQLSAPGTFTLNIMTGQVRSHALPSRRSHVSYQRFDTTLILEHTPVCLTDLNHPATRQWCFTTHPALPADGPLQREHLPHPFMTHILAELLQRLPVQWG